MGVKGLYKFVKENDLSNPYELHDCKIVIDGNNLIHRLYSEKINSVYGGDYNTYSSNITLFFNSLKKCNIESIVVIDGGLDQSDRFFPTQKERQNRKLKLIERASSTGHCESTIFPIFLVQVCLDILSELKIKLIQCEYDSDAQITALANHYDCPLLSDDNDFYIHHVKKGFIRLSSINEGEIEKSSYYFKSCEIYHDHALISKYSISSKVLPLLASLVGNDYLKDNDLKCFNKKVKIFYKNRIPQILEWIRKNGFDNAKKRFLSTKGERADLEELLNFSMDTYKEADTHLMWLIDYDENNVERIIERSELTSPCGERFSKDFILNYYRGNIPSSFLNIINLHRYFLPSVIEEFSHPSCIHDYGSVRKIIYGILLQHKCLNKEHHESFCLSDVREFGRYEGTDLDFRTVSPIFVLSNGNPVPSLSDMENMNHKTLRRFLGNVMCLKESFFDSIPSHLELLFGSINFSVRQSYPKLKDEFISAIILSIINFNEILKQSPAKSIENGDSAYGKLYKTIGRISPRDTKQVIENMKVYLFEPEISIQSPFDVSIVQSYSQIQACLSHFIFLNNIFYCPFERPKIDKVFEGHLLYNLTTDLIKSQDSSMVIERLLCQNRNYMDLFKILKDIVLEDVLEFLDISKNKRPRASSESNESLKTNEKKRRRH